MSSRGIVAALAGVSCLLLGPSASLAQAWPERGVKIIVPTAAGGSIDATARTVGEKLATIWRQSVVIENRPGAAMRIGAEAAAKAAPDGYTLFVAHDGTMAMNPVAYAKLAYDPVKDFAPLGLVASIPGVIMASVKLPARTLPELLDLARKQPGKLNHAHGGNATLLWLELMKSITKVDIKSVPFQGGAPAVTALIGGHVDVCLADVATAVSAMQSDQVRPLAVTSITPSKRYPHLPTADKSGVPGYDAPTWTGMFAPSATPAAILARIEGDLKTVVTMPDVRGKLEAIGMEMRSGTAEEMRKVLATDIAKWGRLVRENNLQIAQ